MKRGFTIIELLVASLLLGMLVTILTMIFNQSSIAWRTGVKGVADLDDVRAKISAIREEADNLLVLPGSPNKLYRSVSLWDASGELRKRACSDTTAGTFANYETSLLISDPGGDRLPKDFASIPVGNGRVNAADTYTVNVKSAGPNKKFDDYDDIWSWPDDFD